MSKLFIFAIGGTGERVLRSTTMLLAAGIPAFKNYHVYPIIIDYDADNADKKRTRDTLDAYNNINRTAFSEHSIADMPEKDKNEGEFFGNVIKQLNGLDKFVLDFNPGEEDLKFRDKIEYDIISGKTLKTKALIESLYDTSEDPTTELNLDLSVGFKGNPNIGSVVFHQLGERAEYQSFVSNYHKNQGDKVIIIGSLFGGTGASGIPVLVQRIKTNHPDADMAALMIQPYFAPEITPDGAINGHLFYSKTKAALNFYKSSGIKDNLRALYHIGDPYPTIMPYSEGGNTQKNNANPIEFIAALSIAHFVSSTFAGGKNEYMFGLNRDIVSEIRQDGKQESCRIFMDDFDENTKSTVLKYMDAFAFAMKYFHDEVNQRKVGKDSPYVSMLNLDTIKRGQLSSGGSDKLQDLLVYLENFYKLYLEWLKELDFGGDDVKRIQPNSHRLAFYNLEKDYSEIVERQQSVERDAQTGYIAAVKEAIGGKKVSSNKYSSIKVGKITAMISSMLKDRGHLDGNSLKTKEREFIFMDILRAVCMDIVNH